MNAGLTAGDMEMEWKGMGMGMGMGMISYSPSSKLMVELIRSVSNWLM
ncbi:hypothetical protein NYE54_03850 [Paenibacillus sp. FSL K6-1330]